MNKTQTFVMVLAAALAMAVCSALGTGPANAAPSDGGEPPVASTSSPLEAAASLQIVVSGVGNVHGPGFNCSQTCSLSFPLGQQIAMSAQEANGYRFVGWGKVCDNAPQSHSCRFNAGDVHVVYAAFAPLIPVSVLAITPTFGASNNHTMRKIVVQFNVGASSVVIYELRQNNILLQSWKSSPFTGSSTRSVWVDDRYPAGAYELRLRVTTGTQVRSGRYQVALPPPQP